MNRVPTGSVSLAPELMEEVERAQDTWRSWLLEVPCRNWDNMSLDARVAWYDEEQKVTHLPQNHMGLLHLMGGGIMPRVQAIEEAL